VIILEHLNSLGFKRRFFLFFEVIGPRGGRGGRGDSNVRRYVYIKITLFNQVVIELVNRKSLTYKSHEHLVPKDYKCSGKNVIHH
jgi:hypothetical protein